MKRFIFTIALIALAGVSAFADTKQQIKNALANGVMQAKFLNFAQKQLISENVEFLIDAKIYFEETKSQDRRAVAKNLYNRYIAPPSNSKSKQINIKDSVRRAIDAAIAANSDSKTIFMDAYKEILGLLADHFSSKNGLKDKWDAFTKENKL